MSRSDGSLFNRVEWHRQIDAQFAGLAAKVQALSGAQLRDKSIDELADALVMECRLDIPVILETEISVRQDEVDIARSSGGSPFGWEDYRTAPTVKGTRITVTVPFDGDKDLFHIQPPTYSSSVPYGEIRGSAIVFTVVGTDFAQRSPKPEIDRNIEDMKKYLEWQRNGLGDFEARLRASAVEHIKRRAAKLDADAQVVAGLGYKVK